MGGTGSSGPARDGLPLQRGGYILNNTVGIRENGSVEKPLVKIETQSRSNLNGQISRKPEIRRIQPESVRRRIGDKDITLAIDEVKGVSYEIPKRCLYGSYHQCEFGDIECPLRKTHPNGTFYCIYKLNRKK